MTVLAILKTDEMQHRTLPLIVSGRWDNFNF